MNLAVFGILAEGVGSGAGVFPKLLAALLERGDRVDFFGMKGFNDPKSLERFESYRFFQIHVPALEWLAEKTLAMSSAYPFGVVSQLGHVGYQRESVRRIELEHATSHYDVVVCTDAMALARSRLPLVCWPQSPPHTEGAALRERAVARAAIQSQGALRYAAVQCFYAYRWLLARAALDCSDLYVCGSEWARDEWQAFGARPDRLQTLAYPIELEAFAAVPPTGTGPNVTFLWLGRAVPRKRLDLFFEGFARLHARRPETRARIVGNVANDRQAALLVERYRGHPAISIEGTWPHERVAELFAETDVLVQPSQNENFGFSVAEALAAGRGVVLGPTNGTASFAGDAAFRFSDYTADAVADAMERAYDTVRRDGPGLSDRARAAAREHFDMERVVTRFSSLCSQTIARARAGS